MTEQEHEAAVKTAIEQERKRICEIVQMAQNTTGYNDAAKQAIDEGKPSEDFAKDICMSGAAKKEEASATQEPHSSQGPQASQGPLPSQGPQASQSSHSSQGPQASQSSHSSQVPPENDAGVAAAAGAARQAAPPSLNTEREAEQARRQEIQEAESTVL